MLHPCKVYLYAFYNHDSHPCICKLLYVGVTVLVDPWLDGDLVFANQTWLYRGQKGALQDVKLDVDQIGANADVILLSQVHKALITSSVHSIHAT